MLHQLPQNPVFRGTQLHLPELYYILLGKLLAGFYESEHVVGELVAQLRLQLYDPLYMRLQRHKRRFAVFVNGARYYKRRARFVY